MGGPATEIELSQEGREHLEALLEGYPVAGYAVDYLGDADLDGIAAHAQITWACLADQPDRDAAIRLLERRIQAALVAGTPDMAWAEIDSPELVRDATTEPVLEALVLRATTALGWDEPERAARARRIYDGNSVDEELAAVRDACDRALDMVPAWRELARTTSIPEALSRFVRLQWVASQRVLDELIADLRRDMVASPDAYLAALDAMAAQHHALLLHMVGLTERFQPQAPPSLRELDDHERQRLDAAMCEIDAPMRGGLRLVHCWAGALAAGALLGLGGYGGAAVAVTVGLGVFVSGYAVWAERGMYSRLVRPSLAAYLAESGMPTGCVVSWLLLNRKAVRKIQAFDVAIDADAALAALARLGRMCRLHAAGAG